MEGTETIHYVTTVFVLENNNYYYFFARTMLAGIALLLFLNFILISNKISNK